LVSVIPPTLEWAGAKAAASVVESVVESVVAQVESVVAQLESVVAQVEAVESVVAQVESVVAQVESVVARLGSVVVREETVEEVAAEGVLGPSTLAALRLPARQVVALEASAPAHPFHSAALRVWFA